MISPDRHESLAPPHHSVIPKPSLDLTPTPQSPIMVPPRALGGATTPLYDRGIGELAEAIAPPAGTEAAGQQTAGAMVEPPPVETSTHALGIISLADHANEDPEPTPHHPSAPLPADRDAARSANSDQPPPTPPIPPTPPAESDDEGENDHDTRIERDLGAYLMGESSTERSVEEEALHMRRLDLARQKANELLAARGAEQPELFDFAHQRAEGLSAGVLAELQHDEPVSQETINTLQDAFAKLHVAFAPDDDTLAWLVAEASPEGIDEPPSVHSVARYLNNLASHMTVIRENLAARGELAGMSPAEQFAHVKGHLELIFLPGIEDDLAAVQQIETTETAADPTLQQFDGLIALAQTNPENTWIKPVRDSQGNTRFQVWEFSHVEPVNFSEWGTLYDHHYSIRDSLNPEDVQHTHIRRLNPNDIYPKADGGDPVKPTVPQLCYDFLHIAKDPEQLGRVMEVYVDWSQNNADHKLRHVIRRLVGNSLVMEENPLADPHSRVSQALANIRPDATSDYPKASAAVSDVLGKMIMGRPPEHYRDKMFAIADQLYDSGLLERAFWFQRGVQEGGAFTVPGMLERTHENLQSDEGIAALASQTVASVESTVRDYLKGLLDHYAQDNQRDSRFADIQRAIYNRYGGVRSFGQLIAIARDATTVLNGELAAKGAPPDERLPQLDPTNFGHLGAALIRICQLYRLPDVPEAIQAQQATHDAMHAGIIEQLRTRLSDSTGMSIADLKLRYPEATDEEARYMLGAFRRGVPSTRVDASFRRSRGGGISRWDLRGKGFGKLS